MSDETPWIPDWVSDTIFYQIFPDRFRNGDPANDPPGVAPWGSPPSRQNFFGGDLQGVIDRLPHIRALGCNAIYLNPIFRADTNHRYDTGDYLQIDPVLGDDATFDRLVASAHDAGIRIVLDGVFNHCGIGFVPFQDVLANGAQSRYRDWFDVYDFPVRTGIEPGASGFSDEEIAAAARRQTPPPNYATCGGAAYLPRLNTANPEVEEFIHRVALHWLDRGSDGWRLDVPYEIETGFWRRFRTVVKQRHPQAYLVAEEWRNPTAFLQGDTFDGATHYGLRGLLLDLLARRALTGEAFLRALQTLQDSLPPGSESGMLTLLGSHDTPRILNEVGGSVELLKLAFTCLLTLPGVPLVYYGDEIGLPGGDDPDCRRTMPWDEAQWEKPLLEHVRRLTELRSHHTALRRGSLRVGWGNDRVASFERELDGERILVVINASEVARRLEVPVELADGTVLVDLLSGGEVAVIGGRLDLRQAAPLSSLVLLVRAD